MNGDHPKVYLTIPPQSNKWGETESYCGIRILLNKNVQDTYCSAKCIAPHDPTEFKVSWRKDVYPVN